MNLPARTHVLPVGFATAVAMWATGYVCRLPGISAPGSLLLPLLLLVVLAAGFWAGRAVGSGWRAGAAPAAIASLLNLLVLGSLLSNDRTVGIVPSALWWIPGSFTVCISLGAAGGALGSRFHRPRDPAPDWIALFAKVAVAATLLLVAVGGLVTSADAGLAVVDWPNSYGYNMFLYPLSRMTGGIYYEHAHRLFGSLVGLTTLGLALYLRKHEPRAWVRRLGYAAFVLVVAQGILGGLRVTGRLTLSDSTTETSPNIYLAVIHGVTGQIFLATLAAIALFVSRSWRDAGGVPSRSAGFDRSLTRTLVGVLLLQLGLGAVLRHLDAALIPHVILGGLVLPLSIVTGVRALDPRPGALALRRAGSVLIGLAHVQVLLGLGALVATRLFATEAPTTASLLLATAHQATGAAFLAASVVLALLTERCRRPLPADAGAVSELPPAVSAA